MKIILLTILACFCFVACKREVCPQGINELPMYGRVQKCKQQLDSDEQFIKACEDQYGSREEACNEMLRFAWKHYAEGNLEKSMQRFNQALLLDSLNADVYTGFAELMIDKGEYDESLLFLERSVKLNPDNPRVWQSMGSVYLDMYDGNIKDPKFLSSAIDRLNKSIALKSSDHAKAYALLTKAYAYSEKQDSAKKYLEITDHLNPDLIDKEVREHIMQK